VLTYFAIEKDNWSVMILLEDKKTVLWIKDLKNLSAKVRRAPMSTASNPSFTDKKGNPLSKVKLNLGDLIAKPNLTVVVDTELGKKTYGSFHISVVKYEFIQKLRTTLGAGALVDNIPSMADDSRVNTVKGIMYVDQGPQRALRKSWYMDPCSANSTVRC
jgi:hypothetical protein